MSKIKVGDTVQWTKWTRWDTRPYDLKEMPKRVGKVLALVPSGIDIRDVWAENKIIVKRDKSGSNISKNERAVVLVMGGAKGTLEYHYAPSVGRLEIVSPDGFEG